MTPFFVADVGNSRIKCQLCFDGGHGAFAAVACDQFNGTWLREWTHSVSDGATTDEIRRWPWTIAAVNADLARRLVDLLREVGSPTRLLSDFRDIPIKVDVESPERVGIDRLLSAFAASQESPVVIVSAGTAVTVDLVDSAGTFRGGVIMPGFQLMARSLNEHTAALPLVKQFDLVPSVPARTTETAIAAGIRSAIAGGVKRIVDQFRRIEPALRVVRTGGDAELLVDLQCESTVSSNLPLHGLSILVRQSQ